MKVCAPDEVAVEIDRHLDVGGRDPARPTRPRWPASGASPYLAEIAVLPSSVPRYADYRDEADLWLRRQLEGLIQAALESTGRLINEFSGNAREAARHRLRVVDGGREMAATGESRRCA
jgi:hypothetical protein